MCVGDISTESYLQLAELNVKQGVCRQKKKSLQLFGGKSYLSA